VLIAGVNRIRLEDSRCFGYIDPQSTSLAASKSRPGHPVFYVTCGHFPNAANVYFSPEDIKANKHFAAPTYYKDPHGDGAVECQDYVKQNVNYPATVDFDWGSPSRQLPDGRTVVTIKFSAKNAFGVPDRMAADCFFDSSRMIEGQLRRITD
jgi:hypothetical protein